jgi:hypothetical protein
LVDVDEIFVAKIKGSCNVNLSWTLRQLFFVDGLKATNLGKEFHFFTCLCDRTFLEVGSDWKASAHAMAERTIRILPNMFSPL